MRSGKGLTIDFVGCARTTKLIHGGLDVLPPDPWAKRRDKVDRTVVRDDHHNSCGVSRSLIPDGGVVPRSPGWVTTSASPTIENHPDGVTDP
jgi:hypothetical protein